MPLSISSRSPQKHSGDWLRIEKRFEALADAALKLQPRSAGMSMMFKVRKPSPHHIPRKRLLASGRNLHPFLKYCNKNLDV